LKQETPMLRQYKTIKDQYKEEILLFRLGDFYEMFLEDAKIASEVLEIVLTSREAGKGERIPMCGIPAHSADSYISRLINKGYKVAICEQVEDPAKAKGLVKREVIKVITPGTLIDEQMLEEKDNNYLLSVSLLDGAFGLAVSDLSTGEFTVTQFPAHTETILVNEIYHWQPKELLVPECLNTRLSWIHDRFFIPITTRPDRDFSPERARQVLLDHYQVTSLEGFGCQHLEAAVSAAGALLEYFNQTQKSQLPHITTLSTYHLGDYMNLDLFTRRNLELVRTLRDNKAYGSLLWVLDATVTAMGGRLLKKRIEQPLRRLTEIEERQKKVNAFFVDHQLRTACRQLLKKTCDLQRLLARLSCGSVNPRELLTLGRTLQLLPEIKDLLSKDDCAELADLAGAIHTLPELCTLLLRAIQDDAPVTIKEGNIFREGYHQELDQLITVAREGKNYLAELEQKEREATGIKSLKIGFNQVFGYYLEVTKANLSAVPASYIRKQTLANAERYITPELKEYEERILGAEEKRTALEYQLFIELREQVLDKLPEMTKTAEVLAELDFFSSLAEVAVKNRYVRPRLTTKADKTIKIIAGRHPVVEKVLPPGEFVPNDSFIDAQNHRLQIITGPNMAGKSTYMRQLALIVLMAQIGSFVPADQAEIALVDRIFTRVGAADDLAGGQSTFMVEMNELSNILNHATNDSLLILDEIGRGTSTFDGLSIAWAVLEYLWNPEKIGARTLFATHYHELTVLEEHLPGVENLNIAVARDGDRIIFLRKIIAGGSDESYGIEVARLAGLPEEVLQRANEILRELEEKGLKERSKRAAEKRNRLVQLPLFLSEEESLYKKFLNLKLDEMTPREALDLLYRWQEKIKKLSCDQAQKEA